MSTPLSVCDIGARYGQMPAPRKSIEGQTGWDFNRLMQDYLRKVRLQRKEDEEDAVEDALMAVIDAMNAPWRLERRLNVTEERDSSDPDN